MSPQTALFIITWAAIVLLFLGLGANLREIRLLRASVLRDIHGYSSSSQDITLGGSFAEGIGERVVLAADSGCPLCGVTAEKLIEHSERSGIRAVLLTFEEPERWPAGIRAALDVVRDPQAWRSIAHLSPPALMRVSEGGVVRQLILPASGPDADRILGTWMNPSTSKGDIHAHA